jgi:hypothetical protein
MNMKLYGCLVLVAALLAMPGCEKKPSVNRTDGLKDAFDARPNEGIRDAGEDIGDAAKDAGRGIKNAGENLKDAVEDN